MGHGDGFAVYHDGAEAAPVCVGRFFEAGDLFQVPTSASCVEFQRLCRCIPALSRTGKATTEHDLAKKKETLVASSRGQCSCGRSLTLFVQQQIESKSFAICGI